MGVKRSTHGEFKIYTQLFSGKTCRQNTTLEERLAWIGG